MTHDSRHTSISVITICFNNPGDVKATCASVDMQLQKPYEHIIIDGSTKTDIKTWLENTPQPPYRTWLCERDKGISDAFNKGIGKATGDLIVLLNSGDLFYNEKVLQIVNDTFQKDSSITWCHAMLTTIRGGKQVLIGKPFKKEQLYRGMYRVSHQTMFVKRSLYEKYGLYDLNIKMAMDYDFLCRIADEKSAFLPLPLIIFDSTGVSHSGFFQSKKETAAIYKKYFGWSLKQVFWYYRLVFLYILMKSALGKFLYAIKVKMGMANA